MISDEAFASAKPSLHQDTCIILLHETVRDNAQGIMQDGLNLIKHYNGEITRVVMEAKSDEDIKTYNYYKERPVKTVAVFSIPKELFGEIDPSTFNGTLFLNCISLRYDTPISTPYGTTISESRKPSVIPSKWLSGIFIDNETFIENPNYILKQENSKELINKSRTEILKEFEERYPRQFGSLPYSKQDEHIK